MSDVVHFELPEGCTPRLLMRARALSHDMDKHVEQLGNIAAVFTCPCGRGLAVRCDSCRTWVAAVCVDDDALCEHLAELASRLARGSSGAFP